MPTYSYECGKCLETFELFYTIKEYEPQPKCPCCKSKKTSRNYFNDINSLNCSIKKADSELKTLGDLADRNRDKMSEDHKQELYNKHNSYKDNTPQQDLPSGMSRIKKEKKTKWPI
jgi:putative FmdB family regulatory protein